MKESFLFEKKAVDPILNLIKDNQKYLTKKENLPQLAKLGYIYNHFWYAGRVCWGYNGRLHDKDFLDYLKKESDADDTFYENAYQFYACEDNPKYKIEMCKPINDKIDNLIYDAWGMHVSDLDTPISSEDFFNIVRNGKVLSDIKVKLDKPNKTFDEWVDILTSPDYEYHSVYPNKKSIANHMLCVIGNGYTLNKDGFVAIKASGGGLDINLFSGWENAKLREDINKVVEEIFSYPEVKQTLDEYYEFALEIKQTKDSKDDEIYSFFYETLEKAGKYDPSEGKLEKSEVLQRTKDYTAGIIKEKLLVKEKYSQYYPICDYSIISKFDKNTHPSYIQAGIVICNEIIQHASEEREDNVKFAQKYLKKFCNEEK